MRKALFIVASFFIVGCDSRSVVDGGFDAAPDVEGGTADAGSDDAGSDDAGTDGGVAAFDAALFDAALFDAATADAATADAALFDAALFDAATADAATADAATADAGSLDGGPPLACMLPRPVGFEGGRCRGGVVCRTGLTCFEERISTLGSGFGIPSGTPDPTRPGEYRAGALSTVPIGFAPNSTCSSPCAIGDMSACGECTTCSDRLGGAAFRVAGITPRAFTRLLTDGEGLCRPNCIFDPATNGGCPADYTCDPELNVCVEACVDNSQCRLRWGLERSAGLVAAQVGSAVCDRTTGRCDWVPLAGAAFGSSCDRREDCPADVGLCLAGGRCTTLQCNLASAGGLTYPCPGGAVCVGLGGNAGTLCLNECSTPAACDPSFACVPVDGVSVCSPICDNDSQCRADERCNLRRTGSSVSGICGRFCDPSGSGLPDAVACGAGEYCERLGARTHGFCEPLDQLCTDTADCFGVQTCEVLGADSFGRCVNR